MNPKYLSKFCIKTWLDNKELTISELSSILGSIYENPNITSFKLLRIIVNKIYK